MECPHCGYEMNEPRPSREGAKYVVIGHSGNHGFEDGQVVTLSVADGSARPLFESEEGLYQYVHWVDVKEYSEE